MIVFPPAVPVLGLLVLPLLAACGGSFRNQLFRDGAVAYQVGPLPAGWSRVHIDGLNLAFHHRDGGTIGVNGLCRGVDDVPRQVLLNHLLLGIRDRRDLSTVERTIDGRAGLHARVAATLDGVAVEMDLVVVRKDGCTYDLQLVASRRDLPARRPDFEALLGGFAVVPRS